MENDFLTIPDFPNYEINSELIVRNKTTGYILSPLANRVTLKSPQGKQFTRRKKALRRLVVTRITGKWVPVPSLLYKYEMNASGVLRNVRTKRVIEGSLVSINGKKRRVSKKSLFWETHGVTYPLPKNTRIGVTITQNRVNKYFSSMVECAKFLSQKVHYGFTTIRKYLCRRLKEIYGWNITYHKSDDLSEIKTPRRKLKT